jgi:hypothetical protein
MAQQTPANGPSAAGNHLTYRQRRSVECTREKNALMQTIPDDRNRSKAANPREIKGLWETDAARRKNRETM